MDPDLVIKFLFREYKPYLKRIDAASKKVWGELLFPDQPSRLDYNGFHRFKTAGKQTPDTISNALMDESTCTRIAIRLQVPNLFKVQTYEELESNLKPHLHVGPHVCETSSRAFILPEPFPDGANCISASEENAINQILVRIKENSSNIKCWKDAPALGAMFIAYALGGAYRPDIGARPRYLLCPYAGYSDEASVEDSNEVPFDLALEELRDHLGLPKEASADRLLRTLEDRQALVIVVHSELMNEGAGSDLKQLLKLAGTSQRNQATIVLFGQPKFNVANCRSFNIPLGAMKDNESKEFLERHWRRYCQVRKHAPADEQGTRLNRARDYYASEKTLEKALATTPTTLRMLAFLASNYRTFSYFDPTVGWAELVDMPAEQLPVEIRLHIDEVNSLLREIKNDNSLQVVEWCSTALYWLTEDAARVLIRLDGMKWETFKTAVNRVHGMLITTHRVSPQAESKVVDESETFRMDLATRAVVQDRWMRRDPFGRACAHHAIAKRLFEHCNDKTLLNMEFPYEPHWGRSRMFFLAEVIRHLIRSCDRGDSYDSKIHHAYEDFPGPPVESYRGQAGCYPKDVLNFCFEKIFWQELNGNRQGVRALHRKLARQHGAYELAGELLELMSKTRQIGRVHPALNVTHHERYHREVMFAQLDLGQLESALYSCDLLTKLTINGSTHSPEHLEYQLDRIVVLSAMDRIQEAGSALASVEAMVGRMGEPHQKIKIRLKSRRAQIQYFSNDFEGALNTYETIAKEDPAAISRDVAHTYIATLGKIGSDSYLQRALTICLQNLFFNTSQGQHHEALGFRVALAHLLRKKGMLDAAEATLDQVLQDIRKFGCSERTYLSFLLEAGRVVSQTPERVARAYAAYLRPCLDRAISLGYVRTARHAMKQADRCLSELITLLQSPTILAVDDVRRLLLDERGAMLTSRKQEVDPRFGFGPAQVEAWLPRLMTPSAVTHEIQLLDVVRGQLFPTLKS